MQVNNTLLNSNNILETSLPVQNMDEAIATITRHFHNMVNKPHDSCHFSKKETRLPYSFAMIKNDEGHSSLVIYLQNKSVTPFGKFREGVMGLPSQTFSSVTIFSQIKKTSSAFTRTNEQMNIYRGLAGVTGFTPLLGHVIRFPTNLMSGTNINMIFPAIKGSFVSITSRDLVTGIEGVVMKIASCVQAIRERRLEPPTISGDAIFLDQQENVFFAQWPVNLNESLEDESSDSFNPSFREESAGIPLTPRRQLFDAEGSYDSFLDEEDVIPHPIVSKPPKLKPEYLIRCI